MFRTQISASPFNCRWIPIGLTDTSGASAYAICMRNGARVVSERECLECPHWQARLSTRPHGFRGSDDDTLG